MRRALALLSVLTLLLAACGDDEETSSGSGARALEGVTVTGEVGEEPTVEVDEPFSVEETTREILSEGDGEELAAGATAVFHYVFVNGRDGESFGSSYDADPATITFDDTLLPGIHQGLEGLPGGSRAVVAIHPDDGFGPQGGDPSNGLEADDTLIIVVDLLDVRFPLERAAGSKVAPVAGQPTVALGDDGAPTITVPEGEPPAELVAQPLIEGEGDAVTSGQTITVHYTGALWSSGAVFDSSWESGTPATFPIGSGGVIPGWDEGLVGRTVGSQVLLVVPPAKGYPEGTPDGSIPPGETLVFVVDILDASG